MSAAAALILMAEAASACAPSAATRLRAGATIVRPVATSDAPPFVRLEPAAPLTTGSKVHPVAANEGPTDRTGEAPAEQCKAPFIHMV